MYSYRGNDGSHPCPKANATTVRSSRQRGFSFVSVLLALLIAAALYFGYFRVRDTSSEHRPGLVAINASRAVACRTNRQNIERDIALWSVNHAGETPSLAALEADGVRIPSCPEGGHYDITGTAVHCSVHR
ncbi:MAG: hypothetical protein U0587_06540 [Candidatus Binatia bacterium]